MAFTCLVHYDLLGVFPIYPYGRHTTGREPVLDHNNIWLPKPGTDTSPSSFRPIVLYEVPGNNDDDDYDDFWTDVQDADDDGTVDTGSDPFDTGSGPFDTGSGPFDTGSGTSCTSDRPNVRTDDGTCTVANGPSPPPSDQVYTASAEVPSSSSFDYIDDEDINGDYNDNEDYEAPGEEKDDDIF